MQTISAILIGLSWLAVALIIIGTGIAVYALIRARRVSDPWGWRETLAPGASAGVGEELEREAQKKG